MRVDANSQAAQIVPAGQTVPESRAGTVMPEYESPGASFEKNTRTVFVEQLEQAQKAGQVEGKIGAGAEAKSRAEILKNLVTERDLEQFKEFGDDLGEEELEVIVTVVEKIKAQLAVHCEDYDAGMEQELSPEQLEKIAATAGGAVYIARELARHNLPVTEENISDTLNAIAMAEETGKLTEDAEIYCIRKDLELTIENVYMAQHSGAYEGAAGYYGDGSGYYAKAAQAMEMENLRPQIERLLAREGLAADEKTIAQAQWLVEKQLPVTKENLLKLQQLESMKRYEDDAVSRQAVLENVIEAILNGKRPAQAMAGEAASVVLRSEHALSVLANATEEQVEQVVSSGQELTIEALEKAGAGQELAAGASEAFGAAQKTASAAQQADGAKQQTGSAVQQTDGSAEELQGAQNAHGQTETAFTKEQDIQLVTARRQLEEVRMQMTLEAAAVMIRSGISVETQSMQELINRLEQIEEQYYVRLLSGSKVEATDANISLYKEVTAAVSQIGHSPAALVGIVAFAQTKQTIQTIHETGLVWNERYRQAEEAYEQVMTRPRSDMGDSIQKAFRNVDAILEEMGLEPTQANARAVRILGYNSMEITYESIARVKETDQKLNTMLDGMKPSAVLQMIREGYNPLDRTVDEVNEELSGLKAQTQEEQENYSEFLWQLEQAQDISKEERSAYIGIYRMLHQIEKTDGAVVGALIGQGAPLTMRNLMMGIRSARHKAMDYKVGEMDGVDGTKINGITEQVEESFAYLGQLAGAVNKHLTGVDFDQMPLEEVMDLSMEQFSDYVQNAQADSEQSSYAKEQMQALAQAAQVDETVLSLLAENGTIPMTMGNILAAEQMFSGQSTMFRQLKEYADKTGEKLEQELMRHFTEMEEQFTDEASAGRACKELVDCAKGVIQQGMEEETITYEQMKNWKLLSSQIRLAGALSSQNDYHIPVTIGGELTNVHVQLIQNESKQEKVAVSVDTQAYGKAAVLFTVRHTNTDAVLEGYVQTDSQSLKEQLKQAEPVFRESVQKAAGLSVGTISYAWQETVDLAKISADMSSGRTGSVSTAALYQTAKAVIGVLKTCL